VVELHPPQRLAAQKATASETRSEEVRDSGEILYAITIFPWLEFVEAAG
jgi:hypothetical protein